MCKCNKGMRNFNGTQMRPSTVPDNVTAIYSNPSQIETIRVFDSLENPTRYLGMARHGYPISVPRSLLNVPRADGSKFVLPEEFVPQELPDVAQAKLRKKKGTFGYVYPTRVLRPDDVISVSPITEATE